MRKIKSFGCLSTTLFSLVAASLAGGVATPPALATACFKAITAGTGGFENSTCTTPNGTKNFVEAETNAFVRLAANEYCVKVLLGELSTFLNRTCSTGNMSVSQYTKVAAMASIIPNRIAPLRAQGKGVQTFSTPSVTVECKTFEGSGETTSAKKESAQDTSAKYTGCKASKGEVTASAGEVEFAAGGTLGVLSKGITFTYVGAEKCTIMIPAGGGDKALESIEYVDLEKGKLLANLTLSGVNYESSGGACGAAKKLEKNGKLKGEIEFELEKGTIEVLVEP